MLRASWHKYNLRLTETRGTSRGKIHEKPSWFILLSDSLSGNTYIGECGMFPGLSYDDKPGYEEKLSEVTSAINHSQPVPTLDTWPSIQFGYEMAMRHAQTKSLNSLFDSPFSRSEEGISINGLIWMSDSDTMLAELDAKLKMGFTCIKLKIGAIDFEDELKLLRRIRENFSERDVQIRVDANGAFTPENAKKKLEKLATFRVHSIEQPIKPRQWDAMAALCEVTPIPIALDEELIGVHENSERKKMLDVIKPQAIILKPSLIGGFSATDEWIILAESKKIIWWATSALETNVGLNAIAQYTASKSPKIPQGLGTGGLFVNNFPSPLLVEEGKLHYVENVTWKFPFGDGRIQ